jgi:DNA-binding LacI/PurR family transcriptional regulator
MSVTLKDLAKHVGVSVTTASRALAGYNDVAEETRQRVRDAAEELGYYPNITARRLQKQRSETLGFIMPTDDPRYSDPFFSELIAGIGNEAAKHEYDLLVSTHSPDSPEEQAAYERATRGGWVDGLIVVRTRENDARIQLLCQRNFPFVAFGRTDDDLQFPYVDEDSRAGLQQLVNHFIKLGHRRIGYIAPPKGLMFGVYRKRGYLETMSSHGLPIEEEWVVEGDMTQRGGAEAAERLLAGNASLSAIICGNDLMAIGVMNRLHQEGLSVGQDIAVAGFDDIPLAAYTRPSLTTVRQPIYEIGRQTCAILIKMLSGKITDEIHVMLTPQLIVRDSSGSTLAESRR